MDSTQQPVTASIIPGRAFFNGLKFWSYSPRGLRRSGGRRRYEHNNIGLLNISDRLIAGFFKQAVSRSDSACSSDTR